MSLVGVMDALATHIETTLCGPTPVIEQLQVCNELMPNPTLPCIDIYPHEEDFQEQVAYGATKDSWMFRLRVRARVGTGDNEGGQRLLLQMMDPGSTFSVYTTILANKTLGGAGLIKHCSGADGYGMYPSTWVEPRTGHLGCEWVVLIET